MRSSDMQRMVRDFHLRFELPAPSTPSWPDDGVADLRIALIEEESAEFAAAVRGRDLAGVADAIADLLYVTLGAAETWGIDVMPIFNEVHAANMAKVGGGRRADGKVMKPEGWRHPDVRALIERQIGLFPEVAAAGEAAENGADDLLLEELRSLVEGEPDWLANLSNAAAFLYRALPDVSWCGFYLLRPAAPSGASSAGHAHAPAGDAADGQASTGDATGTVDLGDGSPRELVLGPFQGKPACIRIPVGRGVCGTSLARRETLVVPDVDAFPGHIACDPDSRSEVVVPILVDGRAVGVLDLDSARPARFTEDDARFLERAVATLLPHVDWEGACRG